MARTSTALRKNTPKAAPKKTARLRLVKTSQLNQLFGSMPYAKVESYSAALLRTIRRELANAVFFTREDLIHLPLFNHVSTMYRYGLVCIMVRFLAQRGDLIIKSRTNIILRGDHEKAYSDIPLQEQHYDTIRSIVRRMPTQSRTTVMDVVALWTTDPYLTVNNKRVAVRGAVTRLVKDGLLRRHDDFEFIVRKVT